MNIAELIHLAKEVEDHLGIGEKVIENPVALLAGTAMVESSGVFDHQFGGGPALGLWQMEKLTYDDCWENFLDSRHNLFHSVASLSTIHHSSNSQYPDFEQIRHNNYLACAMARVKYLRIAEPLPPWRIPDQVAHYWKEYYNTEEGAGTLQEFYNHYGKVMAEVERRRTEWKF